jgi:hypothetical protein
MRTCGAMRSVPQMVTRAIIQLVGSTTAGLFMECDPALPGPRSTDCHSFQVRHRYAKERACGALYFVLSREHTSSTTTTPITFEVSDVFCLDQ